MRARSERFCGLLGEQNVISSIKSDESEANMSDLSLDLNEVQASPKGKIRNEVSILAIWLPRSARTFFYEFFLFNDIFFIIFVPLGV